MGMGMGVWRVRGGGDGMEVGVWMGLGWDGCGEVWRGGGEGVCEGGEGEGVGWDRCVKEVRVWV